MTWGRRSKPRSKPPLDLTPSLRRPHEPGRVPPGRPLHDERLAIEVQRIACSKLGDLGDAQVEDGGLHSNPRRPELGDAVRPPRDDADGDAIADASRAPDGGARDVRIGEEVVDRRSEGVHHPAQLLVRILTASRGRLLTGSTEASVLTSMALPSGRAIWRA